MNETNMASTNDVVNWAVGKNANLQFRDQSPNVKNVDSKSLQNSTTKIDEAL